MILTCGAVGVASAEPVTIDRRCFAGVETTRTGDAVDTYRMVGVREIDPTSKEIRQSVWSARDPRREVSTVFHVDAAANTFEFTYPASTLRGTGTLEGPAWHWKGYQAKVRLSAKLVAMYDGELGASSGTSDVALRGSEPRIAVHVDSKAFECSQLDQRRAELDGISSSASHACFEGTMTTSNGGPSRVVRAIVEQVIDDHGQMIELRTRTSDSPAIDSIMRLAMDGTAIAVTGNNGMHGSGNLVGRPGAWTQYAWSGALKSPVHVRGTLGTDHFVEHVDADDGSRMAIEGDPFDCERLEARRRRLAVQ